MSYVVIVDQEDKIYGPFDSQAVAERIADQLSDAIEGAPGYVYWVELDEWREEWTETVGERIARTSRR